VPKKTGVAYAARLDIAYPGKLNRLTTFFRPILIIPIAIITNLLSSGLAFATLLLIVFRLKYPRWWFEFARELARLNMRVGAYAALLMDTYPSTTKDQAVNLNIDYPNADKDLSRWLPLVKWLLAIPHYIILAVLWIFAFFAILIAWFAILITGRYPAGLFNYVVGVFRWTVRVQAYVSLLVTDQYPPFSMS
jgi:Domain of unknown function (DUF4389)